MRITVFLLFSAFSIATASTRKVVAKEGKICVGQPAKKIKLGVAKRNIDACKTKCVEDEECTAMQYISPKMCNLYHTDVKMKAVADDDGKKFCGRIKALADDSTATAPVSGKQFVITDNASCDGDVGKNQKQVSKTNSMNQCKKKCSGKAKCKAFQWNINSRTCVLYMTWITETKVFDSEKGTRVCGIVQKQLKQCELKAYLAHPYEHPDDAPHFGYNSNYMEVWDDSDWSSCAGWRPMNGLDNAAWCTYSNSHEGVEGANIANLDDTYYDGDAPDEYVQKETIMISGAAGKTFEIYVSHYFLDKDYYRDAPYYWNDHMLAPILDVTNLSNEDQGVLGAWTHPVSMDVTTHNEDGSVNEAYEGKYYVTISCNNNCRCETAYALGDGTEE